MGKSTFHYDKNGLEIKVASDIKQKFDKYQKMLFDPTGAYTRMISDLNRRAPGKVADAVRSVYNIKKADVTPSKKKTDLKKAGSIRISGQTIADLRLYYEGRTLTFLHFDFTPKTVKKRRGYKVKLKVAKPGKLRKEKSTSKKEYGSPFIFETKQGKVLPFHRIKGTTTKGHPFYIRKDGSKGRANERIESIRSLSLPQMVDNKQVRETLKPQLDALVKERFNHHFEEFNEKIIKKVNSTK